MTVKGKKLFIDASGRAVITPQFDIVDDFSEGLAAVNIGQTRIPNLGLISNPGKWGYIDKTGRLLIPLKFTHAEDFSEGLAGGQRRRPQRFYRPSGKVCFRRAAGCDFGISRGHGGRLIERHGHLL